MLQGGGGFGFPLAQFRQRERGLGLPGGGGGGLAGQPGDQIGGRIKVLAGVGQGDR